MRTNWTFFFFLILKKVWEFDYKNAHRLHGDWIKCIKKLGEKWIFLCVCVNGIGKM